MSVCYFRSYSFSELVKHLLIIVIYIFIYLFFRFSTGDLFLSSFDSIDISLKKGVRDRGLSDTSEQFQESLAQFQPCCEALRSIDPEAATLLQSMRSTMLRQYELVTEIVELSKVRWKTMTTARVKKKKDRKK